MIERFTFDEICESQDFEHDAEFIRYEFYYALVKNNTSLNHKLEKLQKENELLSECVAWYRAGYGVTTDDSYIVSVNDNIHFRQSGGKWANECLAKLGER